MYLFHPKKGAEVPDLNALELLKTWGCSRQFQIKSMCLGQSKYIYGLFGSYMDTITTSTQSGGLKMRLHVRTSVLTEVTTFFLTVGSTAFKAAV